ncbi:DUF4280 domain-containing protein [Pedobacter sp. MC2016-15]|uniref:DUF4280 domain-containing protein n=1 Tax=Pedobacter sp. MC2016-15 TaxID=2994473 RepID=UPI002245FE79|nr:DUF4280 domain-containing protein [Pedobacter sp. MC2016-15]MCX2478069.1 DUF4280 domain-containing protein [Pedobacter sp. MC2016-15]
MLEEKEYVTSGAMLKCSCGTIPTPFKSSSLSVLIAGKPACTTKDKVPMLNITPFGLCKTTKIPCIPALLLWMDFQADVKIEKANPLLNKSWIMCSLGGKVEIQHTGQF